MYGVIIVILCVEMPKHVNTKCHIKNQRNMMNFIGQIDFRLSGMASLWNFISLHMKSLGLSPSEIGIIVGTPQFLGGFSVILCGGYN